MVGSYSYSDHYYYINRILDGKLKDTYESFYEFDRWSRRSVERVSEKFIEFGWDEEFITKKFRRLRDEHLESHQDADNIYYFAYIWVYTTKEKGIYEILKVIGLTEAKAREIEEILSPLKGSVFTDRQLILMALKRLLNDQYYRVLAKRGKDISLIKDLVCEEGYQFYYCPTTYAQCKERTDQFSSYQLRLKGTEFTINNAIYLYDNLDFAIEVCRKLSHLTTSGIIVYKLPIDDLPKLKVLEIDEWFTIVCNSRRLKSTRPDFNTHFIHGRICANPQEVYDGAEPVPRMDAGYQLAFINDYDKKYLINSCVGAYVCREQEGSL